MEGYNCPIRYAGEYYDSEAGEYYLSSRYYDSFTGRFTTEDDTSYGKDTDPASLNLYSYCANDPIQYSDPTGHTPSLTGMTSTQLNTYFHSTSGYAENNAIAQSYGYSSALAMVGAYATAETINSTNSGYSVTVTAQQVNTAINQGSTAIYYAVNGGSSSVQAAAALAISQGTTVPYTSGTTPQSPPPPQITSLEQKASGYQYVTAYSLYDNKPYKVTRDEVGRSAGKLLWNSTPDQTERAIVALKLLGVDVDKGYGADWCTPAYVLRWLRDGKGKNVLKADSNRLENQAMQVVLDALGFQASKDWSMDNTFGSYMIGAVRAVMAINGQGWQGNEGGPDSDIGPNVGASIEKMLLGLVYAKDIGSVRAMYNAEQQWQVAKYEGWEREAQEQARLEAKTAKLAAIQANPGMATNGTVQPSIFPTFDQIDWSTINLHPYNIDGVTYYCTEEVDPELLKQSIMFHNGLAKIGEGIDYASDKLNDLAMATMSWAPPVAATPEKIGIGALQGLKFLGETTVNKSTALIFKALRPLANEAGALRLPGEVEGALSTKINPNEIRYSQSSVNGAQEIIDSMKAKGWAGDPIDVVKMSDGKLTTVDNTRVLSAKYAGIDVEATVHAASDPIPADVAVRFTSKSGQVPKTWGEAVTNRINNQNSAFRTTNPNGSYITGWDGK